MRNNLILWFCVHLFTFSMLIAHQLLVSSLDEERRVAGEVCYWLALLGTAAVIHVARSGGKGDGMGDK